MRIALRSTVSALTLSFTLVLLLFSGGSAPFTFAADDVLDCEITIVGGGPAGVYLSYRLASRYGAKLCLFEKQPELGGRFRDEEIRTDSGSIFLGTGARRVNDNQEQVKTLARELQIELQTPAPRAQLIQHKGRNAYSPDNFADLYPRLRDFILKSKNAADSPGATLEDRIYNRLLDPVNRRTASSHASLRSYITAIAGPEAVEYLRGMSRFHGDFDYEISAPNYLDTLEKELQLSAVNHYPTGGMSSFIRKMAERARSSGVRFFTGEPVLEIHSEKPAPVASKSHRALSLKTPKRLVRTQKLILTIPPVGMAPVKGSIATQIRKAAEYRALLPIRVVVINQRWNDDWWKAVKHPNIPVPEGGTWRAWSTDHCVTHIEIPQEPYITPAKLTRSVYTEDLKCVDFWEKLHATGGIPAVEKGVQKGLEQLFSRVHIPKPVYTSFHVWPGAWYYLRAGSKVSNTQVTRWAIQPLSNFPEVMIAGEAYWPDRAGWVEGALFSANKLLDSRFSPQAQTEYAPEDPQVHSPSKIAASP